MVKEEMKNGVKKEIEQMEDKFCEGSNSKSSYFKSFFLAFLIYAYPINIGRYSDEIYRDYTNSTLNIKEHIKKEYFLESVSNNIEGLFEKDEFIKPIIDYISFLDNGIYNDNLLYKRIRLIGANRQISKYSPKSDVLVIDKTFQKALFFSYNDTSYNFIDEFDCGTAAVYGKKQRAGDGKTPEDIFEIKSIESAHDKIWEGKKVYGAYFIRIQGSIGIHGNGTDKIKNSEWMNDSKYKEPDPIGIYKNNFGYGPSHGCVRLPNDVIRELVEENKINKKTKVIIYENKELTDILNSSY